VLRQIGLLPAGLPCVTGPEQAANAADHGAQPSNKLIAAAAAAAAARGGGGAADAVAADDGGGAAA
jgi:hypothetical protein